MRQYAGLFAAINQGKRSVELDLKDMQDQSRALELAAEADVLVEGFRPGVLARLGLDEEGVRGVNPGIVYCSISGYGQHDFRADLPGHDVNYHAWAGALTPEGGRAKRPPPLPTADLAAGLTAAFGICAAVLGRVTSGEGASLDISMTDVLATWTGSVSAGGPDGKTEGTADGAPPPPLPGYGLFTTVDGGQVALGIMNEQHFWVSLCRQLGLDDEVAILDFPTRCARGDELQQVVSEAIATQPRDTLVSRLMAAGVPVAPVLDRQGMLAAAPFPRFPIRLPLSVDESAVPVLDQHRGEGFGAQG
jgi:crotonobetainyl-CoA:carnitine CoA-transferase CaiB-like acyl-CoA transferase